MMVKFLYIGLTLLFGLPAAIWCAYNILPKISPEQTMAIAQSEFNSAWRFLNAKADDFFAPNVDIQLNERLSAMAWSHKTDAKCIVSVYVDRTYASANTSISEECVHQKPAK